MEGHAHGPPPNAYWRKPIEMRACQVVEVADGKTSSIRQYFDIGTLLQQIQG